MTPATQLILTLNPFLPPAPPKPIKRKPVKRTTK